MPEPSFRGLDRSHRVNASAVVALDTAPGCGGTTAQFAGADERPSNARMCARAPTGGQASSPQIDGQLAYVSSTTESSTGSGNGRSSSDTPWTFTSLQSISPVAPLISSS